MEVFEEIIGISSQIPCIIDSSIKPIGVIRFFSIIHIKPSIECYRMKPIKESIIIVQGSTEVISIGSTYALDTHPSLRKYHLRNRKWIIRIFVEIGVIIPYRFIRSGSKAFCIVGFFSSFCITDIGLVADSSHHYCLELRGDIISKLSLKAQGSQVSCKIVIIYLTENITGCIIVGIAIFRVEGTRIGQSIFI